MLDDCPFLKCVVSIWALPVGGGEGVCVCVNASLDGLEHFFPCPNGQFLVLGD